jgi:putative membrane protein
MKIFDLSPVNASLATQTVIPGLRSRFDRHRKMGKFTMPIWRYVSVTGVIVCFMLYQWFPSHFEESLKSGMSSK